MATYCYEYQPLWFSYPIEPKEVGCGIVLDRALGMRDTSKGEGAITGEVEAKSLRAAKMKVSRLIEMGGGTWEKSYHPRKKGYFPCHVKDNQNCLYLWEKTDSEVKTNGNKSESRTLQR